MTVEEVLLKSGFTQDEIKAMEPKAITAFSGVLSEAQQAREAAELAQRSYTDFYENKISPALVAWDSERQRLDNERATALAEAAFYRTQNEEARHGGFIPSDAPGYQSRDGQGRYVAGVPGGIPGSPTFQGSGVTMEAIDQRLGQGISNATWALQTYSQLHDGKFLPDGIDTLSQEATQQRMPFRDFVSRKYDFAGRRAEIEKKQQEQHDAQVRTAAAAERDRFWAERTGSNPDIRTAQPSRYSDAAKAVKNGTAPDPLMLNDADRRRATAAAIRADLAEAQR
jgi:hypothetical protein